MSKSLTRLTAILSVSVALMAPYVRSWLPGAPALSHDVVSNGLSKIWRSYDHAGHLIEKGIDSNFDGRSDVREYYDGDELVRRESDLNFDDHIDLVEEFDTTTHQLQRTIADTDFDGVADRLVLYREGRTVFAKQAALGVRLAQQLISTTADPIARSGDAPLARFFDPFDSDVTLRRTPMATGAVGEWTVVATFICAAPVIVGTISPSTPREADLQIAPRGPVRARRSSRGPPTV